MGWLKCVAASIACVFSAVTYAGDEPAPAASAALAHGLGSVRPRTAHYEPTPQEAAILRKIAAADVEPDRLARCLHYPDPPDTHWNQASVAILCHMQFDPMPTLSELRQKLDKEGPASLDRYFDDLRKAQARPETSWKLDLVTTLRLNCACKEGRDLADAWLARSPDSVWANLASGMQFEGAAVAARGTGFAQETGAERFARMRAMDAKAKAPLERALAKDPGLTPAITALLWTEAREGNAEVLDHLAAALRAHPGNFALHNTAGQLYQAKWYGSDALALEEERKDMAAGAKYPALLMVASDMERERRACGKNCEWSMSDLEAINAIGPYVLIFRQMVTRALRDGEYGRAAIFASEVLRFSVHPEWGMRTQRGTARQMMNDMNGAEADAQAALELEPGYQPAMVLMQTISRMRDSSGKSGASTPH